MEVRTCINCHKMKYIVDNTGECPSCIWKSISDAEQDILKILYESDEDTTIDKQYLKSELSYQNIGSKIENSKIYNKYNLIDFDEEPYDILSKVYLNPQNKTEIKQIIE